MVVLMLTAHTAAAPDFSQYVLDYKTPIDASLQSKLIEIDTRLRAKYGMSTAQAAVGLLDLKTCRLAMIHPDRIEYAASVPKIGILLTYFQLHPEAADRLDPVVERELGEMIKLSSDQMASKYSHRLGLKKIQQVLDDYHFYDKDRGGGIWVGKHYGKDGERYGDPVADHSHAATIRQLLRYYLLLEQRKLVSPQASKKMRQIFELPSLAHDQIKFVKGLAGRDVQIIRKWGSWQDYLHDSAVVRGGDRHYILAALTHHPRGDQYLVDLAAAVDDLLAR
jgi:beta-lactamase class A